MRKAFEYLLIGQGLAGTSLAVHLQDLGASVAVMDDGRDQSSSRVAAGLYNPVTGRKMVKTWMADLLFPYLVDYYKRMEKLTGKEFLHERPIYRPFISVEEQNEWMGKSASPEFASFVEDVYQKKNIAGVQDPFGGVLLKQSGFLNIPAYLDAMQDYFRQQDTFIKETFRPEKLELTSEEAQYGEIRAKKVIFCEGTFGAANTFFGWLPFRPVKGELLEVSMDTTFPAIINRGVFVLEIRKGVFRTGSTYDNHHPDWLPSDKGRAQILEKLEQLLDNRPEVLRHYAGVRPATADRRPIAGWHPEHRTIGLFNGLGTKGVTLSPWFGKHLAGHFHEEKPLLGDVNISRYFSLY